MVGVDVQVFEVDIHRVSIEPSPNCSGDRVQLFDGDVDVPLSEPICGNEPPLETFISRSSVLVVLFQSDQGGADAGFVLGYTVVEGEPDEVDIDDTAASGVRLGTQGVDTFQSPTATYSTRITPCNAVTRRTSTKNYSI